MPFGHNTPSHPCLIFWHCTLLLGPCPWTILSTLDRALFKIWHYEDWGLDAVHWAPHLMVGEDQFQVLFSLPPSLPPPSSPPPPPPLPLPLSLSLSLSPSHTPNTLHSLPWEDLVTKSQDVLSKLAHRRSQTLIITSNCEDYLIKIQHVTQLAGENQSHTHTHTSQVMTRFFSHRPLKVVRSFITRTGTCTYVASTVCLIWHARLTRHLKQVIQHTCQ